MQITDVQLIKLSGEVDAEWTRSYARSAGPLDVYEEFRHREPEPAGATAHVRRIHSIYVEIHTDAGCTGRYGPIFAEQAFLIATKLRGLLLGRDPLAGEALWDIAVRSDRHARAGQLMMAISSVDCALWDLRGRYFDVPVCRLLGGPTRPAVPAYASMLGHSLELESVREVANATAEAGYPAQKWFFRHGPGDGPRGRRANVQLAEELRLSLGEAYPLMFDCWMGWDLPYALDIADDLRALTPKWVEEPLAPAHVAAYARLKHETALPLAAGEHLYTRWDVKPYLDAEALDYIQADPDWTGGITELVKICSLAAVHGVPVIPHGHNVRAALHVVASRSPQICPMVEYLLKHIPRQELFHRDPIEPTDGVLAVPDAPGLGIEFDEAKIDQRDELDWQG
ncbi:MAG: enolase C-terminal domain-like protein [Planctomycetota bacterium]